MKMNYDQHLFLNEVQLMKNPIFQVKMIINWLLILTECGVSCKRRAVPIGTVVHICKWSNLMDGSMMMGVGELFNVIANPETFDAGGDVRGVRSRFWDTAGSRE